jgi:hypothetical protein
MVRRVLTLSGTFVNQQWPFDPKTPGGAWDFHDTLIPQSERKPIRLYMAVGDRDNYNPNVMRDGMHDWVEANHRMAKVLKAKGYPYSITSAKIPATASATPAPSSSPPPSNGSGRATSRAEADHHALRLALAAGRSAPGPRIRAQAG